MRAMGPVSGQAVTLANSIIGVGILAMPFCFKQCGIILSILILILSGFMSRLACHFLLKSATMSRRRNFEVLAYHVFGSTGKLAVEIGIIGFLMGTCVAYFVVVGDLGPQIIAKMFNLNQTDNLRTGVMVIVSVVCVLPLGLLRNVDSLSNVCAATIGFYFCLVLKVIGEASNQLFSYDWVSKVEFWQPAGVLQCLPIFAMALFCQTQLFEIYDTLPSASLDKMNNVTKNAIHICSVVYVLVGMFGYIAFCNHPISGNILVSFSPTMGSDAIKMGFVLSLAFSFPLIIFPCRASLYSLLYKKGQGSTHDIVSNLIPETRFRCLTFGIVAISLLIGLMLPNIELVLGLVGSTIGVMICVIFPATCFICISSKYTNERVLAQIVLCFGIIIMVLGTYANLQAAEIDRVGLENKLVTNIPDVKNVLESRVMKALSPPNDILGPENSKKHDIVKSILERVPLKVENDILKVKSGVKIENNDLKDSKFQPPNPVPPGNIVHNKKNVHARIKESVVVDAKLKKEIGIEDKKSNDALDNIIKDDKEGGGDSEVRIEKVDKKSSTEANAIQNPQDLKREEVEAENKKILQDRVDLENEKKNEKRLEDFKNVELMEKLKHHEEEQRKMIIEQAEILHEIKKTQEEIKKENIVKMGEKIGISSLENKKLALKSIQKLAQIAIRSLGVDINMLTDGPIQKNSIEAAKNNLDNNIIAATLALPEIKPEEKPEVNEAVLNSPVENINENVIPDNKPSDNKQNISNNVHMHKPDEPESYKVGEDINAVVENRIKSDLGPKVQQKIANEIPIAIALSRNKNDQLISQNKELSDPVDTAVKIQDNNELIKNASLDKSQLINNDHFGVERDILEIKTDIPHIVDDIEVGTIPKIRHKRAGLDCLDKKTLDDQVSRICPINEAEQDSFK